MSYLKSEQFPKLYAHAQHTESMVYSAPRASCFYARFTLEQALIWLYDNDAYLKPPDDNNLGALIHEQTFKDNLKPGLFPKVRAIHKVGNLAAHSPNQITSRDSLRIVEDLFHFLYWLCLYYSIPPSPPFPRGARGDKKAITFNPNSIPEPNKQKDKSLEELQQLEFKLSQSNQIREIAERRQQQTEAELDALREEIAKLKQQNEAEADSHDYNEADTRLYLIDVLLQEARWDISKSDWREYKVEGMPNHQGIGYVDYVLWGDDGKPLALIEAKKTSHSPTKGKQQAKLYAECLEKKFNQRPVIFYSNGYSHWIWDDVTYPPREIQGFLTKDELQRLIFRRSHRKSLDLIIPNSEIAGRSYQLEAIRRITETFHKYNQLSEEEKQEYEEKFCDEETGVIPDAVNAAAINRWLFNQDTVDQALKLLVEKGIKVEGGDRLGKTIIFARNHAHAEFIVERFDVNYPHYRGKFAQVIDSHNNYAQSLLDDFSESDKEPTIAVSVDMLDTGVDIPEVVNLVFFKPVYSRVKFNQMIGRGTRLCPNLSGIGQEKQQFLFSISVATLNILTNKLK